MSEVAKLYIEGEWVDTAEHEPVVEAFSGKEMARVAVAGKAELERATQAAVRAFETFRLTSRIERHRMLKGIRDGLAARRAEFADLIARDAGKPIVQAEGEVDRGITTFELAAQECFRFTGEMVPIDIQDRTKGYTCSVERFPIGPIAGITPFNFPLNLLAHKIAPALAVGAPLVVKIPPQAPLVALKIAEVLQEAGVPKGVYNALHMPIPVAETMVRDPRFKLLSFTGSPKVGWHLKNIAGKKKVLLELGGNAGVLVHEDAAIDDAVARVAFGSFAYSGQVCIKVQRVFVHKPIHDRFVEKLTAAARATKAGDPMDRGTTAGPIIDRLSFDRIMSWIESAKKAGATILAGGTGSFPVIQPTLIATEDPSLEVSCEEVFGPVTVIATYDDWEDGIRKLNTGVYGLQAGIFTNDINRIRQAYRDLEVGGLVVNDIPTIRVDNYPYGGVKDSGLGREGVRYTMEEMTEPKALVTRY